MPELPDLEVYLRALRERISEQPIVNVRVASPFVVRTADPPIGAAVGKIVRGLSRLGKRLVLRLDDELFLTVHLMIAGRLKWQIGAQARGPLFGRNALAAVDFPPGTLVLTEASKNRRASIHLLRGRDALGALDRGGVEPLACSLAEFAAALRGKNRTIKRALTDPGTVAGVGNAYSDEILHRAKMSPGKLTSRLGDGEIQALLEAMRTTLQDWSQKLDRDRAGAFPEKVTAFREGMAVHGRYRQPCPDCGATVQRIVRGEHETNYCPTCQTGGKVLADRALSRLMGRNWHQKAREIDQRRRARRGPT